MVTCVEYARDVARRIKLVLLSYDRRSRFDTRLTGSSMNTGPTGVSLEAFWEVEVYTSMGDFVGTARVSLSAQARECVLRLHIRSSEGVARAQVAKRIQRVSGINPIFGLERSDTLGAKIRISHVASV